MAPRRTTQADVARLAGVSRATVSLVLNPHADSRVPISDETRQRVLRAVHELGYTPNPVARMLVSGTNKLIGVFTYEPSFPNEQEDYYHPYLIGIERGAQELGYDVLLFTRARVPGQRRIYTDGANVLRLADGAILLGAQPDRTELCRLAGEGYPFVFIGRREVPGCQIDWVVADYRAGAIATTRYLIQLGHREIGYIGHQPGLESHEDRLAACRSALPLSTSLVILPEPAWDSDEQLRWAIQQHHLTALMCTDERNYVPIMRSLERLGIEVPGQVSVACLNAMNPFQNLSLKPTYVHYDRSDIGEKAVHVLVARLTGSSTPEAQHIFVPCQLVIGETTGPVRVWA